jgi:hypothetical protein
MPSVSPWSAVRALRSSVTADPIDDLQQGLPVQEAPQVLDPQLGDERVALGVQAADVRKDDDPRRRPERMLDGQRLRREDIQHGARDAALAHGGDEVAIDDEVAAAEVQHPRGRLQARQRRLVDDPSRLRRGRQEQEQVVRLGEHAIDLRRWMDPLDAGCRARLALGADHPHAEPGRQAGDLDADGTQPQDAQRGPGKRRVDATAPARRGLVEHDARQALGAQEQRGQDVLGHLYTMRPARAREDGIRRRVGGEPLLAAASQRLHPAKARRAGGKAGRRSPGQQRVRRSQQVVRRVRAQGCDHEVGGRRQAGRLRRADVRTGLVEPDQNRGPVD